MDWTVESELMRLAGESTLARAVTRLRLPLPAHTRPENCAVYVTANWQAGGAETYILMFSVVSARDRYFPCDSSQFVLKACVASPSQGALAQTFRRWLERRDHIRTLGISTPRLYAADGATLLEEYVPLTIAEALSRPPVDKRARLLTALGLTAHRLAVGGYQPVSVHDWRSRGIDVVMIDFGTDLGAGGMTTNPRPIVQLILEHLRSHGIALSAEVSQRITSAAGLLAPELDN